ncbi:CatB-related O-acetyltransferase [Labilibacter marinus]|uniref:CatB-related O-acetyltransferase n=1 Tax=Labilibacter marinus TaxID=1477105 RepID=UPI00094FC00E|nr:CatB-related O-acetyltransferase [Labilibacter marinus]
MKFIKAIVYYFAEKFYPDLKNLRDGKTCFFTIRKNLNNTRVNNTANILSPSYMNEVSIGNYTYLAHNSFIQFTSIGNFCSIGPNFRSGLGIHPTNGLSTHPMFYSTYSPNKIALSKENKIEEFKPIEIGSDVFIGANVTVLDGVKIGNGAIIGAGAVVSKDIPPYAIAVGCPIQIIKYRYSAEQISQLNKIKWWEWEAKENLQEIEKFFYNVEDFISKYTIKDNQDTHD